MEGALQSWWCQCSTQTGDKQWLLLGECRQIQCCKSWIFNFAWKLMFLSVTTMNSKFVSASASVLLARNILPLCTAAFCHESRPGPQALRRLVGVSCWFLPLGWTLPVTLTSLFSYLSLISSAFCSPWGSVSQHAYCRLPQNQAWWRVVPARPEEEGKAQRKGEDRKRWMQGCFWGVRDVCVWGNCCIPLQS